VGQVRVLFPRWNAIYTAIAEAHEQSADAAEPECLVIVGPTGAGKTTLVTSYAQRFPPDNSGTTFRCPVLVAKILAPATVKTLATNLLFTLGDPLADKGSVGAKSVRLRGFFNDCGMEMLILDELQHIVDRDSDKVLQTVSNWLKDLIKDTKVATVLVGLQGEAERVVRTNPQLNGLFRPPLVLDPFTWDDADPATIKEFRKLLRELDGLLPLRESSDLGDRELAWRCFVASRGNLRLLMGLLRRAVVLALRRGCERLDLPLLADAFDSRLAGMWPGLVNPFYGPSPALPPLPLVLPPDPPRRRRRGRRTSREGAGETLDNILER
jgi:energy-coupling factor transporter ATP-binding protein EcfA2